MKPVDKKAFGARVAELRSKKGLTQTELAGMVGMRQQGIDSIESGDVSRPRLLREIADALETTERFLLWGEGTELSPRQTQRPTPNAIIGAPMVSGPLVPLFGQASAGKDGRFPWNGEKIQDVFAPPSLAGVRDAYAVQIAGDSMVPRYFSGEIAFVHPHLPVHKGHFVVAQIAGDEGEPPWGFVKRLAVSPGGPKLKLEQFNPRKFLEFPSNRVIHVHRIVAAGDG